jgi:nondiscriminating glutamyl-tRNA synthetase
LSVFARCIYMANNVKIKTRFAPSPTGFLHVGSLRTALYAYLLAKQSGSSFVLRIEDTDQSREVDGAVENLIKSLKIAGLSVEEGVFTDNSGKVSERGDFGPYTQSKRLDIYQKYAKELVKKGHAYYCFCTPERLDEVRKIQQANKQPTRYDGECRNLSAEDIKTKIDAGEKYVIRMRIPEDREISFTDLVRGKVKFNSKEVDDQVLMKSDGFPTYHLAVVVDDHLMEVTHVIRGEEWLSSTPKHILLYEYFGWDVPSYAHLPLILNPDKTKLSKRQGDVAVEDYLKKGYLPEALVNFIALLGWNPGDEREIFSLDKLVKEFRIEKVHKSGAVFNLEKLDWMNKEYIKALSVEEFAKVVKEFSGVDYELKVLKLEQQRIIRLDEVGQGIDFLLNDDIEYDGAMLVWKKSDKETAIKNLENLAVELESYDESDWTDVKLQEKIKQYIESNNLNNGEVLWPMRVALTGQEKSPTPFEVAEVLGKDKSVNRIKGAVKKLT